MIRAVGLAAVLVLSTAAHAKSDPVKTAERAIAAGDFEKAIKLLDRELKRKHPAETIARIQLLRGQSFAVLQDRDQAREAFRAALEADPTATLDPLNTPPDQIDLFNDARRSITGTLAITTDRPGAEVKIDGKSFGPAPLKLELPIGEHEVEVTAGAQSKHEKVMIAPHQAQALAVELPAAPSTPEQWAQPPSSTSHPQTAEVAPPLPTGGEVSHPGTQGGSKVGSIVLASAGVVLIGAGGYGAYSALDIKRRFDAQQDPSVAPTVTRGDAKTAQWLLPASAGAAAIGLGLAVTGVVGLASSSSDGQAHAVSVIPTRGGGLVSFAGTF